MLRLAVARSAQRPRKLSADSQSAGSVQIAALLTLGDTHFAAAHFEEDQSADATDCAAPSMDRGRAEYARAEKAYTKALGKTTARPEWREQQTHALTGLAKVALARAEPAKCVELLADCPPDDPAVLQLRGEAHVTARASLNRRVPSPHPRERPRAERSQPHYPGLTTAAAVR